MDNMETQLSNSAIFPPVGSQFVTNRVKFKVCMFVFWGFVRLKRNTDLKLLFGTHLVIKTLQSFNEQSAWRAKLSTKILQHSLYQHLRQQLAQPLLYIQV
eukprot:TRINITY_DN6263_c0_g1_i1.p4 TRINITY_DN6263_c0_g1~~TRINITY_DN6263_c0_g1_i1.p4  ORF type:complete len:117 (-),score=2.52 TRINITY_DN6263_c0_g1_i1:657-956(-)